MAWYARVIRDISYAVCRECSWAAGNSSLPSSEIFLHMRETGHVVESINQKTTEWGPK